MEENINKKVQNTYVAKLTYAGPLNLPSRNQQRVKFDITCHEQVVEGPDIRDVFHPYSDAPKVLSKIKCYSISEILAEKTRALYERQGRARDVYDLVNISQKFKKYIDPEKTQAIIQKKFAFKDLSVPSLELIMSEVDWPHFEKSWVMELEHQVPELAPAEDFYAEFISILSGWFKGIEK